MLFLGGRRQIAVFWARAMLGHWGRNICWSQTEIEKLTWAEPGPEQAEKLTWLHDESLASHFLKIQLISLSIRKKLLDGLHWILNKSKCYFHLFFTFCELSRQWKNSLKLGNVPIETLFPDPQSSLVLLCCNKQPLSSS